MIAIRSFSSAASKLCNTVSDVTNGVIDFTTGASKATNAVL